MKYKLKRVLLYFIFFVSAAFGSVFLMNSNLTHTPSIPNESFGSFTNRKLTEVSPVYRVAIVGDILLARDVENSMIKHGASYPYQNLDFLTEFDHVVGNFEASIPEVHIRTISPSTVFSVQANVIPALRRAGFTHLSLANNHSYDFGKDAHSNTVAVLEANNLAAFGNYAEPNSDSISYLELGDTRVALIGVHTFAYGLDVEKFNNVMLEADKNSDLQIVIPHWGIEYEPVHRQIQRTEAQAFVKAGADLVVGHHPHVVQDMEYIESVPVFYSLGNFIFDQYFSKEVQTGLMLELVFDDDVEVLLHPVTSIGSKNQPRLMDDLEREDFLADFYQKNGDNDTFDDAENSIYIKDNLASLE